MKTIAIIEDDEYISGLLTEALTEGGYAVARAYSGTEALMLLEKKRPDLILMDLMLPGISGESLLPHLKGIPVIVVSAKTEIEDKVKLLLNGAVDYVTKPFHVKELLARIAVRLREAQELAAYMDAKVQHYEAILAGKLSDDTNPATQKITMCETIPESK